MKLYHYSKDLYVVLMSGNKSGKFSKKEMLENTKWANDTHRPGPYGDSISFFFDPIPADIIGKLYNGGNDFWIDGNTIYEYIIDTSQLEHNILFSLVESPTDVSDLDNTKWIDTDEFLRSYIAAKEDKKRKNGETSTGIVNLEKQIRKYIGTTKKSYINASKRPDFKENITKYAANVPHLMLYPKHGVIGIESINTLTISSDIRMSIKVNNGYVEKPHWGHW